MIRRFENGNILSNAFRIKKYSSVIFKQFSNDRKLYSSSPNLLEKQGEQLWRGEIKGINSLCKI